jgi:hypothetical protein
MSCDREVTVAPFEACIKTASKIPNDFYKKPLIVNSYVFISAKQQV